MQLGNNRTYIIIDAREVSILDFSEFLESRDTVLYNSDQTRTVVKYTGSAPSYRFQYPTEGPYTLSELRTAQSYTEWPDEVEENPDEITV
jgi:hypothetical protein|tara:strand:- start:2173 stop:2442 length:270 start_codon:yes stop_codon:yes gene_type:complete